MTPEQRDNLLEAHAALTARVAKLETELAWVNEHARRLQEGYNACARARTALEAENEDLKTANLPLYSDRIANLERENADLQKRIGRAFINGAESHAVDLENENARLKAELTTLQKTFREISDDHDEVHSENAALLEALKDMVFASELHGADSQQFFDARNVALAAIAKAEGR